MYKVSTPIRSSVTGTEYGHGDTITTEIYNSLPKTEQNHFTRYEPGDIDYLTETKIKGREPIDNVFGGPVAEDKFDGADIKSFQLDEAALFNEALPLGQEDHDPIANSHDDLDEAINNREESKPTSNTDDETGAFAE